MENDLIPFHAEDLSAYRSILVVAPHPDDEVFGCGGTVRKIVAEASAKAVALILTDGAGYGHPDVRRGESERAASVIGYSHLEFLSLPDRGLEYGEELVSKILASIHQYRPDVVFAPSLWEVHPDHLAAAASAFEAARRSGECDILFYEIGAPLRPNVLVDITRYASAKRAAMACFESQIQLQNYERQIDSLNLYRTYTLDRSVERVEAFARYRKDELMISPVAALAHPQGEPFLSMQAHFSAESPLVSVMIRSMDRDSLQETLNSIAAQTWPNVEILVVNAKGSTHRPIPATAGRFPIRFIDSDRNLPRARAANVLLQSAGGDYCVFVDDDDLLLPNHISNLLPLLLKYGAAVAAYGAVRCINAQGELLHRFGTNFDRQRLRLGNYIPLHAAIFRRAVAVPALEFDERFDFCEDWDFWIQLASRGDFIFSDVDVAIYRLHADQGFGISHSETELIASDVPVIRKWIPRWSDRELFQMVGFSKSGMAAAQALSGFDGRQASDHEIEEAINRLRAEAQDARSALATLRSSDPTLEDFNTLSDAMTDVADALGELSGLDLPGRNLPDRARAIAAAYFRYKIIEDEAAESRRQTADAQRRLQEAERMIQAIYSSRSWRMARPLRGIMTILRAVKSRVEQSGPYGAAAVGVWNDWRRRALARRAESLAPRGNPPPATGLQLLHDDRSVVPLGHVAEVERIAVHVHVYYEDLIPEIAENLSKIPRRFDLFVSVAHASGLAAAQRTFQSLHRIGKLRVSLVPNRGRDLAPFFVEFREELRSYDAVLHVHSKKSLYSKGAMDNWRGYLFDALLGSEGNVERIFGLLESDSGVGIVYPQNYEKIPYTANTWLANRHEGRRWCAVLGIPEPEGNYFDFPAGSMFWARPAALKPLFDYEWALEDFPEEAGQNDGTTAHVLERLLVQAGRRRGYRPAILRDLGQPNWSPWRADGYFSRTLDLRKHVPGSAEVRVVMVDIFDTLLTRPLLDAESVKKIVARHVEGTLGARYLQHRATMEQQARARLGRDVNLFEIFEEFVHRDVLTADEAAEARGIEEQVEIASVSPRQDVVDWVRSVARGGRRVVLVSDMFLPRATVERMLAGHGVEGWSDIYLSNEVQARKDAGTMYDLVLRREGVSEPDVLMVGDNERSDVQIPGDRGIRVMHVMRPLDQARILPRWRSLLRAECARQLDGEVTLGLILRRFFGRAFPSAVPREDDFTLLGAYGIGYAVVGPMLAAFSAWLHDQARRDGRTRLLFLAREGELLKVAFDRLAGGCGWAVRTDYLELSRRCVTVARIADEADVLKIAASADFFADDLGAFVEARYGLNLTAADLADLERRGIWQRGRAVRFSGVPAHLHGVLADLTPRILAQARREREGLDAYLDAKRIDAAKDVLVDVGYSGTIQDALSAVLGQALPGYYMMTRDRIAEVVRRHSSFAKACFGELLTPEDKKPAFWVHPFEVEQLLSSDEAQVLHYVRGESGDVEQVRQSLSEQELAARPSRTELRRGAMDFIDAVIGVHRDLLPGFEVPAECAEGLFKAWADKPSATEREALRALVLDDYYCGRGVVEPFRGPAQHGGGAGTPNVAAGAVKSA